MMHGSEPSRQQPSVIVQFSTPDRRYEPLQSLDVRYAITNAAGLGVRALERSVLWYTEGKGEEDLGVHFFERLTGSAASPPAGRFSCILPASPLSYEGLIVKIRWCARIRLFFAEGRDFVSEHIFDLGRIPAAGFPGCS